MDDDEDFLQRHLDRMELLAQHAEMRQLTDEDYEAARELLAAYRRLLEFTNDANSLEDLCRQLQDEENTQTDQDQTENERHC